MTSQQKFGIVVMLDALGVSNFSIDESKKFIEDFDEISSEIHNLHTFFIKAVHSEDLQKNETQKELFRIVSHSLENVIISQFGDTLIMAWPLEKEEGEHNLSTVLGISMILNLLIYRSLFRKIPFRGCISIGDYVSAKHNKTILGPAIFDANSWYNSADWVGIIFSPKAQLWLSKHLEMNYKKGNDPASSMWKANICEYDVPLTEHAMSRNSNERLYVLGWPSAYYFHSTPDFPPTQVFFKQLFDMSMPKGTESKFKNTVDFFKKYESEVYLKNPVQYNEVDHPVMSLLSKNNRPPNDVEKL